MMIVMGMAMPSWKYVMQNEREQELFFRGDQIASAIERFQRKNANAFPPSMEILVKGRFLRKAYTDPMIKDGRWRFIRPGEVVLPGATPGNLPGRPPQGSPSASPGLSGGVVGGGVGGLGPGGEGSMPFIGVASTSTEKSLRIMNGRESYDMWLFMAGQPRVLGRNDVPAMPGGRGPSPGVGGSPAPGGERRDRP